MTTLEICCADICSVKAAVEGGADRIELCTALEEGGLTPSGGLLAEARRLTEDKVRLQVLIRPRPGDYVYTRDEIEVMKMDIDCCGQLKCDGVVIGALNPDGTIDEAVTRELLAVAAPYGMSVTFHRAFDLCRDPEEALDLLIKIGGIDRVLTSGLAPSAPQGVETLAGLVRRGVGKIGIMPGAGVNSGNAAGIISATGATEIHASAKSRVGSDMQFRRGEVSMGAPGADEYSRFVTSAAEVAAIVKSLSHNQ